MEYFIKNLESGAMPIYSYFGPKKQYITSNTPQEPPKPIKEPLQPQTGNQPKPIKEPLQPQTGNQPKPIKEPLQPQTGNPPPSGGTPINITTIGGFDKPTGGSGSTEPVGNAIPITEPFTEDKITLTEEDTFYDGGYGGGGGGGGGLPPEEEMMAPPPEKRILGLKPKMFYGLTALALLATYFVYKSKFKGKKKVKN